MLGKLRKRNENPNEKKNPFINFHLKSMKVCLVLEGDNCGKPSRSTLVRYQREDHEVTITLKPVLIRIQKRTQKEGGKEG